jgi:hypothetical protein
MESLQTAFEQIPDPRQDPAYPLAKVLTLVCLAMLCGCNTVRQIASWVQRHRWELRDRCAFPRRKLPSLGTFQRVLWQTEAQALAGVVGGWGEAVLRAHGVSELEGVALDGKTLRGSATAALPARHLLSGLSHRLHLVLGQVEVGDKTNEIPRALPLLADLVVEGRVITTDALLTQDKIAQQIVEKKGIT